MIHKNYSRLTKTEKTFVDKTAQQIMREFRQETFLPYGLLGDDRAEYFVEAFATWLTESAKDHGLKRYASGIEAYTNDEVIWSLEVFSGVVSSKRRA